ncbi:MAG: hypothetical protein Q9219_007017 [cf. Caloplaca sp. 3 TL-2023]
MLLQRAWGESPYLSTSIGHRQSVVTVNSFFIRDFKDTSKMKYEIQQFAQEFCPNHLATASASATQASLMSSTASSSQSPMSVASTATPTASATEIPTRLGAGMDGTNWQDVPGETPDHNRGPAIKGVCVSLFVIAASVVAFR